MKKISLNGLDNYFQDNGYILIVGLGFDQRCLSVVQHFSLKKTNQVIGISNAGWEAFNNGNIDEFKKITNHCNSSTVIGENTTNIIDIADQLSDLFNSFEKTPDHPLVIDVTSLSHELLSIMIGIMNSHALLVKTTFLYVGASEYSFNTPDELPWLSRGISEIRSVLGFPGIMRPSKKMHLIVLAGFETERAKGVILQYEPSSLSIGLAQKSQSVTEEHFEKNKIFFESLNLFVKDQDTYTQDIKHFEFSCIDPYKTKTKLEAHIENLKSDADKNIVVCPLNTKLSTLGVILTALENPEIQICYAVPEVYNTEGYARPGKEVTVIPPSCLVKR